MIEIRDVTKRYGEVTALDGVSMAVDEGSAVGVVGTNGAGKTTLFRLLVGHTTPDSGSVEVAGQSPTAGAKLRERVGFVPEDAAFDPRLTGREVLEVHARLRGVDADTRGERVERVLSTIGLQDAADRRIEGYSNGMTQRLAIGTALVRRPDVLLLDEPTAALDPQGVDAFNAVVDRVRERTSVTLVLTSHVLSEVERLCDRVLVLHEGAVDARGSVDDVSALAGDSVTVRLRPAEPGDADDLGAVLRDTATVEDVRRQDDTIVVRCPRPDAFDAVSTARAHTELAGFEVEEPGLADAFDVVVDRDRDHLSEGMATDSSATDSSATDSSDGDPVGTSEIESACADGGPQAVPTREVGELLADVGSTDATQTAIEGEEKTEHAQATPSLSASIPKAILGFAGREYRIAARSRWPVGLAVLFAVFTAGIVQYGATGVGASTVPATIASIAALSTYLVPLAALAFGYATVVGPLQRGELDVLYALPVPRWTVVVGAYAGRAFAFAGAIVLGFAAGGAVLFRFAGVPAVHAYLPTVAAAMLAGLAFLAIGVLVSTLATEKAHALGGALLAWAWFVLVHDVVALTAVVLVDLPASALAVLIAANPADCLRILGMSGVPTAGGGAGALGATELTVPVILLALVAWIVLPLAAAARLAGRHD